MQRPRAVTLWADRTLSRIGLGTMGLSGWGTWGPPRDRASAHAVLRRAADLGVSLIDTASSYGDSELAIAEALHPYPDSLVIATKGGFRRDGPWAWRVDCRPEALRKACHSSLRRLRVDTIELYLLHTVDRLVPFEESVGALAELQAEGKIRHVGLSNVSAALLDAARPIVDVTCVQSRYSLGARENDELLDACAHARIPFLAWHPLGRGTLARRGGLAASIAARRQLSAAQVSLAWLLHRSPVLVPIPGMRSVRHLENSLAALDLALSAEEIALLDAYRPSTIDSRAIARGLSRRLLGRTVRSARRLSDATTARGRARALGQAR